jgi:hypothetical protein
MARVLEVDERLVQIGQTALRAPDGTFLPAQPLYIIVSSADADQADERFSEGEGQAMTDVSGIFAEKFARYAKGMRGAVGA